MAARVLDFRPPDRASPTTGAAFRTGPLPSKSASTQRRPTLRTNPCVSTERRPAHLLQSAAGSERRPTLRTSSDAGTQPRTTLQASSNAGTEPRTTLRTSSDVSTKRRPPVRPIPFVSEKRRPALRPFDFHVLSFFPGRIADETGFPPVRTRRRQAKAVSPPSEHRTTMRRCDSQSRFLSHCASQSHLSRRRFLRWRPANEPASPRGIRNNSRAVTAGTSTCMSIRSSSGPLSSARWTCTCRGVHLHGLREWPRNPHGQGLIAPTSMNHQRNPTVNRADGADAIPGRVRARDSGKALSFPRSPTRSLFVLPPNGFVPGTRSSRSPHRILASLVNSAGGRCRSQRGA